MTSDLPNADILTKVRGANCLTESELQSLSSAILEVQLRRELDSVDSQWENDMRKYVSFRRSKGGKSGLVLVSRGEGFAGVLVGLGIASYGGYMIWQILQDSKKADDSLVSLPFLFFAVLLALGAWLVINSFGQFHVVTEYERERGEYLARRKQLTAQLPKESRFPARYCPNCLSWDSRYLDSPPW
ncbi:MAG: hypothetical protein IAE77_09605 [Prosthecobacter sp.]|uniref:hypothetical protein n=1 Tax=Prosthecobacter sp. TaxID=1965333 RepID=UPI001A104BF2|nr:hypothetical protein [Prosthecobacter sp.]MBE2283697.1 hypothetical protein [Prosthecobacter sp.]